MRQMIQRNTGKDKGRNYVVFLLSAVVTMMLVLLTQNLVANAAITTEKTYLPFVESAEEITELEVFYMESVEFVKHGNEEATSYVCFELTEPSWIYLSCNASLIEGKPKAYGIHVDLYSDAAFSNKVGEYGRGLGEVNDEFTGFLTAGKYYLHIRSFLQIYDEFSANINQIGAYIPVTKVFDVSTELNANKTAATISFENVLGEYTKFVEYQKGNISLKRVRDNSIWKWEMWNMFFDGSPGAKVLTESDGQYSFTVKKNGYYTIMLQDTERDDEGANRYSVTVKVKGIDKTKPTVTGVKNGKTYRSVKIKYSDKGSGIKSAKLNGANIKSGTKVTKKGSYKLVVTDQAGNQKVVRFCIRK